jgi:hypothetical protein
LVLQVDRDGQTRRIVGGGVDAQARRELIDELTELPLVPVKVEQRLVRKLVVATEMPPTVLGMKILHDHTRVSMRCLPDSANYGFGA